MSSGAKAQLAWVKEVTPGITPPGDWHTLTRINNGVTSTYNSEADSEIGADRMAQGTAMTTVDVGGDIGSEWRYGVLDEFVAPCFGKSWVANVPTMGNDRISSSLTTHAADIGVAGIARGAQVATMVFDFPGDNEITIIATFAATGWSGKADDTSFIVNAQPEPAQYRYSFKDINGLELNDQQAGEGNACVDNLDLQSDNAVQTQRCIGNGSPFPGNIIPMTFTPPGSTTISWSKMAYQLWKAQQTGDAISLEFTANNADGDYRISLLEMEVNGSWPDAGAEEVVQAKLNYTARCVPPTITRLPAPIVIASVTVTPDTAPVAADETVDLGAEVLPIGAGQTVTWSTSDAAIVTANDTGLVTGVAAGTATITATSTADPTKTDTCAITVTT